MRNIILKSLFAFAFMAGCVGNGSDGIASTSDADNYLNHLKDKKLKKYSKEYSDFHKKIEPNIKHKNKGKTIGNKTTDDIKRVKNICVIDFARAAKLGGQSRTFYRMPIYDINLLNFFICHFLGSGKASYDLSKVYPLAIGKQITELKNVLNKCPKVPGFSKTENAFDEEVPINKDGTYYIHKYKPIDFDLSMKELKKKINFLILELTKYLPKNPK